MPRPCFTSPTFPRCLRRLLSARAQVTIPKFDPQSFCATVERERVTHTVLVPTMINLLTQFPDARKYDLSSLAVLAYGGSPMAPELMRAYEGAPAAGETGSSLRTQRDRVPHRSAGPGAYARSSVVLRAPLPRHRSASHRRIREASRNRKNR